MKIATKFGLMMILLGAVALAAPAQNPPPAKVDYNKIVGNWSLEVNAGQEFYTLPLVLKVTDGKLEGTLSEQNGMFKDAPLTSIEFDGQTLKFEAKTPTPPDGAERPIKFDGGRGPGLCPGVHFRRTRPWIQATGEWRAEGSSLDLKLAADKLEGLVSVADLGLSVPVTGVKK